MRTGMLLNAIICLLLFAFSFYVAYAIQKRKAKSKADFSFAGFWLFASLTWLTVAVDLLFYWLGVSDVNFWLNQYGVQTFVFAQIVVCSYYASFRLFKKENIAKFFLLAYFLLSAFALYFMYVPGGLTFKESSFFSVEYNINPITWNIFQVLALTGILFLVVDLSKILFFGLFKNKPLDKKHFFAGFSIIIYGVAGYFDNQGFSAAWTMVLARLIMIAASLLAYLAYSKEWEVSANIDSTDDSKWGVSIFQKFLSAMIFVGILPIIIFSILILTSYHQIIEKYSPFLKNYPSLIEEAEANYQNVTIETFLIFVLVIVFIVFFSHLLSRKFLSPIKVLIDFTSKLKKGDLSNRVDINTGDEFQKLATAFNKMTDDLEKNYSDLNKTKKALENKVGERTKELEDLNRNLENKIRGKTSELQIRVDDLERFKKLAIGRELKMIELKEEIKKLKNNKK